MKYHEKDLSITKAVGNRDVDSNNNNKDVPIAI